MWFGNKSADSSVFPIKWWGLCPMSWNWGWLLFILSHRVERRLLHKFQRLSQKRPRYFCLVPLGDWLWEKPLPCKASDYPKTSPSGVEFSPSWWSGWNWTRRQDISHMSDVVLDCPRQSTKPAEYREGHEDEKSSAKPFLVSWCTDSKRYYKWPML